MIICCTISLSQYEYIIAELSQSELQLQLCLHKVNYKQQLCLHRVNCKQQVCLHRVTCKVQLCLHRVNCKQQLCFRRVNYKLQQSIDTRHSTKSYYRKKTKATTTIHKTSAVTLMCRLPGPHVTSTHVLLSRIQLPHCTAFHTNRHSTK